VAAVRMSAADRREQIISVAGALFAEQGFKGTTTKQIALKAEITEALVFRYFEKKENLYLAIIDNKMQELATWDLSGIQTCINLRDDAGVFESTALIMFEELHRDPTLMRLLLFSALEDHALSDLFFKHQMIDLVETLGHYIRGRMDEKAFHTADPMLAARGFIGMIIHQVLMRELFRHEVYVQYEGRSVASAYTRLFLDGIETRGTDEATKIQNREIISTHVE
jgi:AcrR family transcriptional regulator